MLDMGLEDRMKQPVGLLSGGQRQALTLVMATIGAAEAHCCWMSIPLLWTPPRQKRCWKSPVRPSRRTVSPPV